MDILSRCELAHVSGLAKHTVVMTACFRDPSGTKTAAQAGTAAGEFWYNLFDVVGANALVTTGSLISPEISRAANATKVKVYDLTGKLGGGLLGSPIDVEQFTLAAPGAGTALPGEVAYVATLETAGRAGAAVETADGTDAGLQRDRPKQRHTGRMFFGPFVSSVIAQDAAGVGRPGSNVRDTVQLNLIAAKGVAGGFGFNLAVWSRQDGAIRDVTNISLDDSWDTMRSRGASPTVRTRYAI